MTLSRLALPLVSLLVSCMPCVIIAQPATIQIHANLSDTAKKIYHADLEIPVHRGVLDLVTPEWIPGDHGPEGPVHNLTGLRFEVNGKALPWRRDPIDTFEYHLDIPANVTMLHAHIDCVGARGNRNMVALEWQSLLLYPAHVPVRQISIQPTVTVAKGWGIGTALQPVTSYNTQPLESNTVQFAPTTVEMLQDSPIIAGQYFREYQVAPGLSPTHFLDVIGPTATSTEVGQPFLDQLSHLVRESISMYGPPHYATYHFLVYLRRPGDFGGLEHHQSSTNSVPPGFFTHAAENYTGLAGLLPHEYTHSWNGKFRRPDGLATPDYATPMQNNLLWVYEGLTNYLGDILGERVGTITAAQYRQELALVAATEDAQSGRAWRSIEDTTFSDAMPNNGSNPAGPWASWKRSTDYYSEGSLFWLNVDTTIRKLSQEKKSIRDFLLLFLQKGEPGVARVEPYDLSELERDLGKTVQYDWATFIRTRLYDVQPRVNTEGIEQAGYRLTYASEPTPELVQLMANEASLAPWLSVGLKIESDGSITDVRVGSAAGTAGLSPGQKLTSVNGRVFSLDALLESIRSAMPLQVTVQDGDTVYPVDIAYRDGLRYPRLVRVDGTPDRLAEILTPLTAAKP